MEPEQYDVITLLSLFEETRSLMGGIPTDQGESVKNNEPRYYRIQMLLSLFKAFHLGDDLQNLETGSFIRLRPYEEYIKVIEDYNQFFQNHPGAIRFRGWGHRHQHLTLQAIYNLYVELYQIRRHVLEAINPSQYAFVLLEGILPAYQQYTLEKVVKLARQPCRQALKEIENFLALIINPAGKVLSRSELIASFGFPDVNLHEIDMNTPD